MPPQLACPNSPGVSNIIQTAPRTSALADHLSGLRQETLKRDALDRALSFLISAGIAPVVGCALGIARIGLSRN